MNKLHFFISLIIASVFLFFFTTQILAVDLEVTCDKSGCSLNTTDPLFDVTNFYPGAEISKTVRAINSYGQDASFAIETVDFSDSYNLGGVLNIIIKEVGAVSSLYDDTLANLSSLGYKILSVVSSTTGYKDYDFTVSMLESAGDKYQDKTLSFDLNLGFGGEPLPAPTPPPPPPLGGAVGGVTTVARGIGGVLGGILEGLEEKIEGEEAPLLEEEGVVSGAGVVACQDPFWWPLAILLQLIATLLIHRQVKEEGRPFFTAQIITAVAAVVLLAKFFCPWWLPLIGAAIGAVAVYLGLRRVAT